jgi:glycosyltransferase involved in cell wall biosynthesis
MPSVASRILLVSAYGPDARRGNATTCRRYVRAAEAAGFDVVWVHGEGPALDDVVAAAVAARRPDLLHGHHALRTGPALRRTGIPYVLSEGGTEFELVERRPELGGVLREAARGARAVLFAGSAAREAWIAAGHVDAARARLLPRATLAPAAAPPPRLALPPGPLRTALGLASDAFVVLVASGLRPGKDPLRAVRIFDALRAEIPSAALVLLGLPVDPETTAAVRAAAAARSRVFVPPPVPTEAMAAHYADADVVLNTSRFEGVANALLEAQAAARPVVAHAIPANVLAVDAAETGALFRTDAEAVAALAALARDPAEAAARGVRGHAFVRRAFSPDLEAAALVAAYRAALAEG